MLRSQQAAAMHAEGVGAARDRDMDKFQVSKWRTHDRLEHCGQMNHVVAGDTGATTTAPVYMDNIRASERCLALMKSGLAVRVTAPAARSFVETSASILHRNDVRDECSHAGGSGHHYEHVKLKDMTVLSGFVRGSDARTGKPFPEECEQRYETKNKET